MNRSWKKKNAALAPKRKRIEEALRESEERSRSLFGNSMLAISQASPDGGLLRVNMAYARMYGFASPEQVITEVTDIGHQLYANPDDRKEVLRILSEKGVMGPKEIAVVRRDGTRFTIEVLAQEIRDVSGKLLCYQASHIDVTERKRTEEALRASEERLRLAIDAAGFGTYSYDFVSGTSDWSPEFKTLLGVPASQPLQLDADLVFTGLHPEDRSAFLAAMTAANDPRGDGILRHECRVIHPDGTVRFLQVRGRTSFAGQGTARHAARAAGVVLDITERKQAEEALWEERQLNQQIIQCAQAGITVYDRDSRCLVWNPYMEQLTGVPASGVLGRHPLEVFPLLREAGVMDMIKEALAGVLPGDRDIPFDIPKTGRSGWMAASILPRRNADGVIIGAVATVRDITERIRSEETLQRSQAELKAIYDHAPVMMCVVDEQRCILYVNKALTEFAGVPEGVLKAGRAGGAIGCVNALTDPRGCGFSANCENCALRLAIEETFRTGCSHNEIEHRLTLERGGLRQNVVLLGATALIPVAGHSKLLLCLVDITARKADEDALRESEVALAAAQRIAHIGSWRWNLQTDTALWSDETYRIFGIAPGQLDTHRRNFLSLIHSGDRARVDQALTNALIGAEDYNLDYRIRLPDGTERIIHAQAEIMRSKDGKPIVMQGTVHDITERIHVEENLRSFHEQLRALATRIEHIREEERTALARELHDELGQGLTALQIDLAWLDGHLRTAGPADLIVLRDKIAAMVPRAERLIETTQAISSAMRPEMLDDLGLVAAVEWLATDFEKRTGLACVATLPAADIELDPAIAVALFRIMQEALTNVIRHAQASHVEIRLHATADELTLEISDNGCGIKPQQVADLKSLGLFSMRERAAALGGTVVFWSENGRGTTVTVHVPRALRNGGTKENP